MEQYKKIIIYYFSGTGNSRNVASWFAAEASRLSIDSEVINISLTDRLSITRPTAGALIVFVSPVHGFNYPPAMINFIARFPSAKNNVLLMNTRAGMLIGKFITPGLTGAAFFLASIFLKIKGYKIVGMFPVDMPSNWISVHPGLNKRTVSYLHERNKEKVTVCATRVLSGRDYFKSLREVFQDLIVSPIAILYYLAGRFVFARTYIASRDCNNCDLCIKNCPVKAIIKVDNRPFWTFRCESCMKCMSYCPEKAIETAHGLIALYSLFISSVMVTLFYQYFTTWFFPITNELLKSVLETSIFLGFLGIWYRIVHYMLRFKWFERVVVYTSLTKYKWWGRRYRALKDN